MIDEKTAIDIAWRYLRSEHLVVDSFAAARHMPGYGVWACCFLNRQPENAVESPGMTIVDVNDRTGEPSLFPTL